MAGIGDRGQFANPDLLQIDLFPVHPSPFPSRRAFVKGLSILFSGLVLCLTCQPVRGEGAAFSQQENVVYMEEHGVALVMDIFTPTGPKNGLGIVDVISGAWHSDRSKIQQHMLAQAFNLFCKKGYTVFAVRPGSITKYNAIEMRDHLNQGIVWVKKRSKDYGVDPDRLGMMGASAGGHLALLTAVTAPDADPMSEKTNTRVKAVGVFFPPTNLLNFGEKGELDLTSREGRAGLMQAISLPRLPYLNFDIPVEQKKEFITQASPALLVKKGLPPMLLIHGDADPVVPLSQSEEMVEALKKVDVPVELIVKKGGAHPWPTIYEEMAILTDWFDKQL